MNPAILILSSLGGIVSFITGVVFIVRAIMKNVTATRDNTIALLEVEKSLIALQQSDETQNIRLAVLEDRANR